jgi:hypothetical protein
MLPGFFVFQPVSRKGSGHVPFQLLGRFTELKVGSAAFTADVADKAASQEARSLTVAANWYPVEFIKYYMTFERTVFDAAREARGRRKTSSSFERRLVSEGEVI